MASNPTYYDGDLRRDLLDAALASIEESGPAAVSLRSVARTVGVSHAAPQKHFSDKTGLFSAIAAEGFRRLATEFDRIDEHNADPLDLLGRSYVRFALDHPAHFAVMWDPGLHGDPPAVAMSRDTAFETLLRLLDAAEGAPNPADAVARGERAWAIAHGLAVLLLSRSLIPPDGMSSMDYVSHQLDRIDVT